MFLVCNNWFLLLKKVKKEFLIHNKVAKLRQRLDKVVAKKCVVEVVRQL